MDKFIFGFLTPLFRADIKWAIIQFVLAIVSYSVSLWVFPFFYNKIYIKNLLNKGYYPATDIDEEILINKGFIGRIVKLSATVYHKISRRVF